MNTVKTIEADETSMGWQTPVPAEIAAARFYEEKFVPALFQHWSAPVIKAAGIARGHSVLDIACGTGILTREVAAIVGENVPPTGLDLSAGMLALAQELAPRIEWRQGNAQDLPYPDNSFDRVVCQFGLMFFTDRSAALAEMRRVLKPGGRLALSVWDSLENNPGFARKVEILEATAGRAAADALRAPFCLGDTVELRDLTRQAGISDFSLATHPGQACFPNIHEFVSAELRGWLPVMDVHLDEATIARVELECERHLVACHQPGNPGFVMPTSAHICSGSG